MFWSPKPVGWEAGEQRLRIHAVNHAREGDNLTNVLCSANPGHHALKAHAKAGVRHAAIAAQVQIPLEGLLGQLLLSQSLDQKIVTRDTLSAADDFAVTLRSQHVKSKRQIRPRAIGLHIEGFDRSGITMNHHPP